MVRGDVQRSWRGLKLTIGTQSSVPDQSILLTEKSVLRLQAALANWMLKAEAEREMAKAEAEKDAN